MIHCPFCGATHKEDYLQCKNCGYTDIDIEKRYPKQGLKFDTEKIRMELLPSEALEEIAKVLTKGAEKYQARNWEKGIKYGRVYGALLRHLNSFWKGEDYDKEWNIHHLAHAGCCLMFLLTYELRKMKDFDDRAIHQAKACSINSIEKEGEK